MRVIKQIFLTVAVAIGLSLAVCAQKDDGQKRPPRNPPVVDPGNKPPKNPPKDGDKKPKKPGFAMEIADKVFLSPIV